MEFIKKYITILFILVIGVTMTGIDLVSADITEDDSKKALEGFLSSVESIQESSIRCVEEICISVKSNADKRHELISQALRDNSLVFKNIREVQSIVREDMLNLQRCEADVCKEILSQERQLLVNIDDFLDADSDGDGILDADELSTGDLDGDGYGDVALRGEKISLVGFGAFSVSKIHESDTQMRTSALYSPESALLVTSYGGGSGKVSLNDLKLEMCPEDRCETVAVDINIENQPPVAIIFEPGFATKEHILDIDKKDIRLTINDAICSQEQNEIKCTNENKQQFIVVFDQNSEMKCESNEDGNLYCWGNNENQVSIVTDFDSYVFDGTASQRISDMPNSCIVVRDRCPEEAIKDGVCIVSSDVCGPDSTNEKCIHLAQRCPADMIADGSCVVAADICGQSNARANSPCPEGEELCMDGTCEPVMQHPRCESDLQIVSGAELSVIGQDCDDGGCDVRPGVATDKIVHRDIASRAARDRTTPLLYQGVSPRNFTDEDIEGIGQYLRNKTELKGADFGLAVAYSVSNNSRVRNIRYDNQTNTVEIEHDEEVRLFGLLRMNARAKTIIHENGTEETMRPWWSFLASKQSETKFKAGAELSKAVN